MNKRVLIYTMKHCGYCRDLKKKLDEFKITYVNKDIDIYETEYDKVSDALRTDLIPLIKVGDIWLVPERDFQTIDECAEKIKNII